MDEIQKEQESGIEKVDHERKRIQERTRVAFIGWWEKLFTTLIGLIVFAFMLTFITCFPTKIKNYDGS